MLAVECALVYLEKEWDFPRWMFLNSEWQEYTQEKVRMKKRLRKLKEKLGYDFNVAGKRQRLFLMCGYVKSTKPREGLPAIDSTTFKFPYVIIKLEHNITYTGIL